MENHAEERTQETAIGMVIDDHRLRRRHDYYYYYYHHHRRHDHHRHHYHHHEDCHHDHAQTAARASTRAIVVHLPVAAGENTRASVDRLLREDSANDCLDGEARTARRVRLVRLGSAWAASERSASEGESERTVIGGDEHRAMESDGGRASAMRESGDEAANAMTAIVGEEAANVGTESANRVRANASRASSDADARDRATE